MEKTEPGIYRALSTMIEMAENIGFMDKPEKAGLLFGYFKTNRLDLGFLKKRLEVHGIPPDIRMRLLAGLGLHE